MSGKFAMYFSETCFVSKWAILGSRGTKTTENFSFVNWNPLSLSILCSSPFSVFYIFSSVAFIANELKAFSPQYGTF